MLNPVHFLFSQQEISVSPIVLCHRFIPINSFIFYFLSRLFFLLQRQITCDLLGEKKILSLPVMGGLSHTSS